MKEYEIVTRNFWKGKLGGMSTFLTEGRTIKSALRNLINRSGDFRLVTENEKKIRIEIKEME